MKAILIEKSVEKNSRGGSTKFLILFGGFRARLANKSMSYEPYDLIFVPSNRVGVTCPVLSYVTFCNILVHLFSFLNVVH